MKALTPPRSPTRHEPPRRTAVLLCALLWLLAPPCPAATPSTEATVAGSWQPQARALARVRARTEAALSLPFTARIRALSATPGAQVHAGDVLARFDAPELRRQLAEWQLARQASNLAQKRLAVMQQGRRESTVTRNELLATEEGAAQADRTARMAWQGLAALLDLLNQGTDEASLSHRAERQGLGALAADLSQLKAPFDGIVAALHASVGEQLSAGAAVLELESLTGMYLSVGVNEAAVPAWREGQTWWQHGDLRLDLHPLGGTARLDPASGLWLLDFETGQAEPGLQDGAWVEVWHRGPARPVVWVPASAVVARNGKTWVMVPGAKETRPVAVEVGPAAPDGRIPVLEGLTPGTPVVTEGAYELLYRDLKDLIKFVD